MRYTRMYADDDGESHFEDIDVEMISRAVQPPNLPAAQSAIWPVERFRFLELPSGLDLTHPAPGRQFFAVLAGGLCITTSDGESRTFTSGDVVLAEDTTGKGHRTVSTGLDSALMAISELQ